jgi:hypothetical protein
MKPKKQQTLEQAGWRVGDAADFLEMSPEERRQLDAKVANFGSERSPRQTRGDEENL